MPAKPNIYSYTTPLGKQGQIVGLTLLTGTKRIPLKDVSTATNVPGYQEKIVFIPGTLWDSVGNMGHCGHYPILTDTCKCPRDPRLCSSAYQEKLFFVTKGPWSSKV